MEVQIIGLDSLPQAASQVLDYAGDMKVFLFEGDMGVGKTTMIQEICKQLGSIDAASSPTYSIVNEYLGGHNKIYHFDFFRINDESEAYDLGFEEYLYSGDYCFIEWPEKIGNLWPSNYVKIRMTQNEAGNRTVFIDKI